MEPILEAESEYLSRFDVFLLTEYRMLSEQRKVIREATHAEVTLFFAAVTAVGIAMGFVVRDRANAISPAAFFGGFLICLLMAVIGVITVRRLIGFHFRSVQYARGLNLIRDYFIDNENVVQRRSVVLDTVPNDPKIGGGLGETTAGIVALVSAGISGLGCFCFIRSTTQWDIVVAVVLSIMVFAVVLGGLFTDQVRRLRRMDDEFFARRESVEQAYQLQRGRSRAEELYRRAGVDWKP
jgi:hypothetical protein